VIYKNEEDKIIIKGKSGIGELTVENWGKKWETPDTHTEQSDEMIL